MAASFAYGAGTKMMEAFARLRRTASRTLSMPGPPSPLVPLFPGVPRETTFGPKSIIARVWNCPWWPVIPWTGPRLFLVRSTASLGASRFDFDRELGGFLHGLRRIHADGTEHLLRLGFVHPFDPCDHGDLRVHLLERLLHSERHGVRFRDAAEDVQQNDRRIRLDQELECLLDFRRVVRPAEVQERPALSAFQAQDVQGGHREPRAVRDDADVPVELDECDPLVVSLLLEGGPVLVQVRVFRMTILGVVVNEELGVSRDHAGVFRDDERIDLAESRIFLPEQIIGVPDDGCELVADLFGKRELLHEASEDVRLDPDGRRDVLHVDLVARDRLDVDPALRARHEERLPGRSIDGEAEVELPSNVQPFLEVHRFHAIPVDVHAEDLAGDRAGFVQRIRGLDAAGLSASADEDLCLDHAGEGRFDDRPDLRRGPTDERLVRGPDVVQGEEPFLRLQAELRDDLEDGLPRDAGEVRRGPGGDDRRVADDEEVLRGCLGHVPVDVEHQGLVRAVLVRLDAGHDVVQVIQRLDRGAQALGGHATIRRGHHFQAPLVHLAVQRDARLRNHDHARSALALPRVEAEIPLAPRDDGSDVPFADVVPAARLEDDVGHLLLRVWDFQVDGLGRVVQPVEVAVQLEDSAVVGPDPFENAVAVEEAMVEHADLRLGLRVELAVDVDT